MTEDEARSVGKVTGYIITLVLYKVIMGGAATLIFMGIYWLFGNDPFSYGPMDLWVIAAAVATSPALEAKLKEK